LDVELIANHGPKDVTAVAPKFTLERLNGKHSSLQNRLKSKDAQELPQQLGEVLLCWQQLAETGGFFGAGRHAGHCIGTKEARRVLAEGLDGI
jgi:hypothetical protein